VRVPPDTRHRCKQECSSDLYRQADLVIVDSKKQACFVGETLHAIKDGFIAIESARELGAILDDNQPHDARVIISDLSGLAAQDYEIASFVLNRFGSANLAD
jgi:ornithine cyclodeaminase/alanine dehydrogenase-like protein (mu-crystallin family)